MRKGLTIFGAITIAFAVGFASVLFLMPFWVNPFLLAVQKGSPADWIGFAGNVGAGAMTLIAAAVAWLAVQRQISLQRAIADSQAAIERFNILQAQLTVLEDERRLISKIRLQAQWSAAPQSVYLKGPSLTLWQVSETIKYYDERLEDIEDLETEFDVAGTKRWFFGGGKTRYPIFIKLAALSIELVKARSVLKIAEGHATGGQLVAADVAPCLAINLDAARDELLEAARTHEDSVSNEIDRLTALLRACRYAAGL
jgi:hypothetical protein